MPQHINSQDPTTSVRSAEIRAESTALPLSRYQTWPGDMRSIDDMANQNASGHIKVSLGSSENTVLCAKNGTRSHTAYLHHQKASYGGDNHHARAGVIPLSVSNGPTGRQQRKPLATIIEQLSLSTSQSPSKRPSSLSKVANDALSHRHSDRSCGDFGKRGLHQSGEHGDQLRITGEGGIDDNARTDGQHEASNTACRTAGTRVDRAPVHRLEEAPGQNTGTEWKGLKEILREIAQHTRRASRRSESKSSVGHWSVAEGCKRQKRNSSLSANSSHDGVRQLLCPDAGYSFEDTLNDVRAAHTSSRPSPMQSDRTLASIVACTRDESTADPSFEESTLSRGDAPSNEREGSVCTNLSTSYSSTVLGVDLDLQHYPEKPASHRSTSTSMWFTAQDCSTRDSGWYTVTSSALPVLLPLAAASGIVKQNHSRPLSFYSPSGNLIQAVGSCPESETACFPKASVEMAQSGNKPPATIPQKATLTETAECTLLSRLRLREWSSFTSSMQETQANNSLGALAAHILRLCFCQPHDLEDSDDRYEPLAISGERPMYANVVRQSVDNGSDARPPNPGQGRRNGMLCTKQGI
ncbi:hypothetical protein K491DRAFT_681140 [Lophiostoma macrostomum CBS 122681]|uniref:Uncharacterized protein n=1 Tax=Lophiostoma macrostomum CBS 122681 TaxID=1314788 RepID=A0A6A6SYA0_9PLEO|nr:hypothetical protein K491DRAFT_681140 [Lophiostoma macrostomum CBS 122681]